MGAGFNPLQMFNFWPVPVDVHFGYGALARLPVLVARWGGGPVLIVTDANLRAAGVASRVEECLAKANIPFIVFDGVEADSGVKQIDAACRLLREQGATIVVGVGGGSSLDTAKAVGALATNPGSPLDYAGFDKVPNDPLPVVAIPTTAGTGSETSVWSVFTDETVGAKKAIGSLRLYPKAAVCDPELTVDLPPYLTAATGLDALGHAVESYTSNHCQPISGALALQAIRFIGSHLRSAVLNGRDRAARYAMMLASTLAGMAMNPTRLGLAHALAMPLGSDGLKIHHGTIIGVTLPHVMEFNHRAAAARFADIAEALGEPVADMSELDAASRAVFAVRELAKDVGMPDGFARFGLREEHVRGVVEIAMRSDNVLANPRRATAADLEALLRRAL